jgi:hypothetical protein
VGADLLEQLRAKRRHWVEVKPGRRVRYSRPPETELHKLAAGITVHTVCEYVDGWEGFTTADVLGDEIGSDLVAEFTPALFAEWLSDRVDLTALIAGDISKRITEHLERRAGVEKNSAPS